MPEAQCQGEEDKRYRESEVRRRRKDPTRPGRPHFQGRHERRETSEPAPDAVPAKGPRERNALIVEAAHRGRRGPSSETQHFCIPHHPSEQSDPQRGPLSPGSKGRAEGSPTRSFRYPVEAEEVQSVSLPARQAGSGDLGPSPVRSSASGWPDPPSGPSGRRQPRGAGRHSRRANSRISTLNSAYWTFIAGSAKR